MAGRDYCRPTEDDLRQRTQTGLARRTPIQHSGPLPRIQELDMIPFRVTKFQPEVNYDTRWPPCDPGSSSPELQGIMYQFDRRVQGQRQSSIVSTTSSSSSVRSTRGAVSRISKPQKARKESASRQTQANLLVGIEDVLTTKWNWTAQKQQSRNNANGTGQTRGCNLRYLKSEVMEGAWEKLKDCRCHPRDYATKPDAEVPAAVLQILAKLCERMSVVPPQESNRSCDYALDLGLETGPLYLNRSDALEFSDYCRQMRC
ncbi:hypothetical protein LTR66_006231 [Elasticomyces elasticus]|nr:hypothetical protein LTR66_006231 [Elasticomyces elasticus]